jgi:maleate cis-trans isomerase
MYGWRARIGLLLPSVNGTMEKEMWQMAPQGVTMCTTRFASGSHGTPENLRAMEDESKAAARLVADGQPNVAIYGCTSGSFFEGVGWDKRISKQLEDIVKAPTITTSSAMVDAIRSMGLHKIDVVTPYVALTNERLVRFLNDSGIEVGSVVTFGMLDLFSHSKIQPSEIYQRAMETASSDSSGLFIACTQLRAIEVIDLLERDLGRPVLSANQVSAWGAFKTLGIDPQLTNHGSLMRNLSTPKAKEVSPFRRKTA